MKAQSVLMLDVSPSMDFASILNSSANLTQLIRPRLLERGSHAFIDKGLSTGSFWSLVTSFVSTSDLIKLFIYGGLLETARRFLWRAWNHFLSYFYLVAHLEQTEQSYRTSFMSCTLYFQRL